MLTTRPGSVGEYTPGIDTVLDGLYVPLPPDTLTWAQEM